VNVTVYSTISLLELIWVVTYAVCAIIEYYNVRDARLDKEYAARAYLQQPTSDTSDALRFARKCHRNERKRGAESMLFLLAGGLSFLVPPAAVHQVSTFGDVIIWLFIANAVLTIVDSVMDRVDRKKLLHQSLEIPTWMQRLRKGLTKYVG
jgi:hypothetical protein